MSIKSLIVISFFTFHMVKHNTRKATKITSASVNIRGGNTFKTQRMMERNDI